MNSTSDILIVGAGLAGAQVAVSLRQGGYEGTVGIIGDEPHAPYDRPPLSKGYLRGEVGRPDLALKSDDFFGDTGVELVTGRTVTEINPADRMVTDDNGERFGYGQLVWAAGGSPRRLSIPGAELDGVLSLRSLTDADRIREAAGSARSAAIIGGGHIGLELAAAFRHWNVPVTVIEAQDRLLARVTCPIVSDYYHSLHRNAGVDVRLAAGVDELVGEDGRVCGAVLSDGSLLTADLVIVGIGLVPNIQPLARIGASCSNGVDVDSDGRTSIAGIFAVGDCANREHPYAGGSRVRLESVPNATEQAKIVANAILGQPQASPAPPWFWSHQYDTKLQTVGLLAGHDEAVVRGDIGSGKFSVVYLRNGVVIALDCINNVRDFARGKLLVQEGVRTTADAVRESADLKFILDSVGAA
ncbi:NAD(P)/FAD-dependent oxidoreductase [Arthrobacter mobilis]|uniref:FAD-dependent oxidoreductase n=1 Tax=Arthrobacter mobilis TaxID=2724944 RepID=A0A7X6QMD7_9MICC|nr:FAD-dependent oxidoreductase [Arthrobacter mobilis]NKX56553.1 FAD-dependent oxidoreductase [Arthrobacter mobilis]